MRNLFLLFILLFCNLVFSQESYMASDENEPIVSTSSRINDFKEDRKNSVYNFKYFSLEYSPKYKGFVWASYRLTSEMIERGKVISRDSIYFFKEGESLKHSDYTRSGYDRGHGVPFASMYWDKMAAMETFSMLNIVPQTPFLNRGPWQYLERYERKLADATGCIQVVIETEFEQKKKGKLYPVRKMTKTFYTCNMKFIAAFPFYNLK